MKRLRVLVPLLLLSTALLAQSQPQSYQLMSLYGTGSKEFSSDEIAAATGLKVGQQVTFNDLQEAANKLANTGAFSSVTFKYGPEGSGYTVTYQVEDAKAYLPVIYENFVWTTNADLTRYVAAHFPLFHGKVSETGEMMQHVCDVLTQWLGDHHLQGTVGWQLQGTGPNGPIRGVSFYVQGIDMPVTSVKLLDTPNLTGDERSQVEKEMARGSYEASVIDDAVESRLMPFYRRKGYLRARVVSTQVTPTIVNPGTTDVALTFTIEEGRQYRVQAITYSGNTIFPTSELEKLQKLHPGQIANWYTLQDGLEAASKLYENRGYFQARLVADGTLNNITGEVSYKVNVVEGPLFHMGQLEIVGFDPKSTARLLKAWKLKPGDPYAPSYIGTFLRENMEIIHGRPGKVKQNIGADHVVNVKMEF